MVVVFNLDHLISPNEWEDLLRKEIRHAECEGLFVEREFGYHKKEGELIAYIFTIQHADLICNYLHGKRLGFRRLNVEIVQSKADIEVFLTKKIQSLIKLNLNMTDEILEKKVKDFFMKIPATIRPAQYDPFAVYRLIDRCLGRTTPSVEAAAAAAAATTTTIVPTIPQQEQEQELVTTTTTTTITDDDDYNNDFIWVDPQTNQLHFTPLFFGNMGVARPFHLG